MNSANFNQLLCKNVSSNGENITGIFDTLVCEKGTNSFYMYVLATQILNDFSSDYDKYYYRIVLRQFGNSRENMKNYRVDSGIFGKMHMTQMTQVQKLSSQNIKQHDQVLPKNSLSNTSIILKYKVTTKLICMSKN